MNNSVPKAGRWSQREMRERARFSYLSFDWPEPVSIASKGYVGTGGVWCLAARSTLEIVATLSAFPGLRHWSARSVVYVGRSASSMIAVRLRPTWIQPPGEAKELWRVPLAAVRMPDRAVGNFSLVDFDGHPVWVPTDEIDSLLAGRRTA